MRVIDGGGNAVDGAIAANAVLGVVAPETCGVGGDLFALVHQPGMDAPATLNASGRAGSGVSSELLRRDGHRSMPSFGPATVTVPGCVDGWFALHARFGRQALRDVLSPAIELAEAGFPASKELSRALTARTSQLSRQEAGAELFVEGEPPGPGTRLSRHSLANTLRLIANGTREDFYLGGPGEDIVAATENRITAGDLGVSQADWVQPLSLDIFGLTGWTIPPNSQGYLTLAAATVYESLSPPADPESPLAWHLAIEAYRSLVGDRDELIADPDHADEPASLLDRRYLSEKAALVDPDRRSAFSSPSPGLGGTAYLCTIDAEGTGVSFIQSNFMGIGSGIGAGGSGFFLHNRGAGFNLRSGHRNELAPGKRPLHTLSPTLWTADGRLATLLGTRGGDAQPQYLLQTAIRTLKAGLDPAATQARPRWHIELGDSSPAIAVEPECPTETITDLRRRGHEVVVQEKRQSGWGPVSIIKVDADGLRVAAADPRVDTASAVATA
jgi:gamma-glutamyltranspeptidase/glutathione hydrolase